MSAGFDNAIMQTVTVTAKRKSRVWATSLAAVVALGPGARRLARKSAIQLSRRSVAKCVFRLQALLALEQACKLRPGDVLVDLIARHGVRAIDIARVTERRPNDLSQQYHTAKMFPPAVREPEVPYNSYLLAMRMSRNESGSHRDEPAVGVRRVERGELPAAPAVWRSDCGRRMQRASRLVSRSRGAFCRHVYMRDGGRTVRRHVYMYGGAAPFAGTSTYAAASA